MKVKTLMLALSALLHTKQGSNQVKANITRKKIPSRIIDKNKRKKNPVRKANEKYGSNKEKNRSSEKDSLPTDKKNKGIYVVVDRMVKHVEGWKLEKSTDKDHNVYVRSFSRAKVKCMQN